ncbi:MAG TPA: phosphatase PAP2 family protein [Propionicimonas sp.]
MTPGLRTTAPPRWRRLLRAGAFGLGGAIPVVALAFAVRARSGLVLDLDASAISSATAVTRAHPALHTAMVVWQEMFHGRVINPAVSLVCLWVWRRHGLTTRALWGFLTLMAAWALGPVVKELVRRARPVVEDAVSHAPGYSFPSGHAANAAAAGLTLILVLWPLLGPRARTVLPVVVGVLVVLTALDRVYLGVHYPSDVVGGILFGGVLVGASYLGFLGWNPPSPAELIHHDEQESPRAVPPPL